MGPRLFSRGNCFDRLACCKVAWLQWGHDFSAVEMAAIFRPLLVSKNWPFSRGSSNLRAVLFKVPTSSQEYSQLGGASSASRSSRNHITSRKGGYQLFSFRLNDWGSEISGRRGTARGVTRGRGDGAPLSAGEAWIPVSSLSASGRSCGGGPRARGQRACNGCGCERQGAASRLPGTKRPRPK